MQKRFGIAVVAALSAMPIGAYAQGMVGGMTSGMERGAAQGGDAVGPVGGVLGGVLGGDAVGPVGGVLGGVLGGVAGGVGGLLGVDQAPGFNAYAMREGRSSYRYDSELRPGAILPRRGVTYYRVPPEYGVSPRYRYTIVNDHAVLVDPRTRRIVQVIR